VAAKYACRICAVTKPDGMNTSVKIAQINGDMKDQ